MPSKDSTLALTELQALIISKQFHPSGKPSELLKNIELFRRILNGLSEQENPALWAQSQSHLAVALSRLGAAERNMSMLHEAVAANKAALKVYSLTQNPDDLTRTQLNLASVLKVIAQYELEQLTKQIP
jgi:hypothetical protein